MKSGLYAAGLVLLLNSCAVGPDYIEPDLAPPAAFMGAHYVTSESTPRLERWWGGFCDPKLTAIVDQGLSSNLSINAAQARLAQARASRQRSELNILPGFQVSSSYEESEISKIRAPGIDNRRQTVYEGSFDALWELDLFGRVRRGIEASQALEDARTADVLAMQQSIVAEVVRTYLELRGFQHRMAVARDTATKQGETAELTQKQFNAGAITELDVSRARADVTSTLASVSPLQASVEAAIFRLGVLTGKEPGALVSELSDPAPIPFYKDTLGITDPQAMLRQRPDLRRAERELAAAVANVGVAIGEYFPKVEIIGDLTFEAGTFSDLFGDSTRVYSVGPQLSWRVPEFMRVTREVDVARSVAHEREANYRQAVLSALEEVEGALSRHGNQRERYYLLQRALSDTARAAELARKQYEAGAVDLLTVLDAERQKLSIEDALTQSQVETVTSLVAVVKALGIPVTPNLS